jgi:hypothetical protein
VAADPAEATFLAATAARGEEVLAGLGDLGELALELPLPAAAALAVAGLVLLLAGARRRRPIGILGGAVVGLLAALAARHWIEARWPGFPLGGVAAAGTVGLAVLGGMAPRAFVLAAGALPGAVLGAAVPIGDSPLAGAVAGAAALGALTSVAAELTAAAVASTLGALLLGGGLLAAVVPPAEGRELVARPFALLAWVVVLGAVGVVFQQGRAFQAGGGPRPGGGPLSPEDRPADRAARSPGSRA